MNIVVYCGANKKCLTSETPASHYPAAPEHLKKSPKSSHGPDSARTTTLAFSTTKTTTTDQSNNSTTTWSKMTS